MICVDWVACVLMGAGFLGLGPGTAKARPTPMRTEPRKPGRAITSASVRSDREWRMSIQFPDAAPATKCVGATPQVRAEIAGVSAGCRCPPSVPVINMR